MNRRHRSLAVAPRGFDSAGALAEAERLHAVAATRYREVDLLVAAMREHIRDLQAERDRLLSEVAALRDNARRGTAAWLVRGQHPQRPA